MALCSAFVCAAPGAVPGDGPPAVISGWQESVPGRAFYRSATLALAWAAPVPPASDGIGACHGIKVKTFLNAHSTKHL